MIDAQFDHFRNHNLKVLGESLSFILFKVGRGSLCDRKTVDDFYDSVLAQLKNAKNLMQVNLEIQKDGKCPELSSLCHKRLDLETVDLDLISP